MRKETSKMLLSKPILDFTSLSCKKFQSIDFIKSERGNKNEERNQK